MLHHSGCDFAASRSEYLNGLILAKYLGFDFIDAENVIFFRDDGTFDQDMTNTVMREEHDFEKTLNAIHNEFVKEKEHGKIIF